MSGLIAVDGAFHRLRLPVLTLGSGPSADVSLAGLAAVHCIIAPTPSGPALRSFADGVRVNGEPAVAALLKHGDVIEVGSQTFTLAWHGHNLETEVQRVLDELNEREADLNARDEDLQTQRGEFDARLQEHLAGLETQFLVREQSLDTKLKEHAVLIAELGAEREIFAAERRAFTEQVAEVQAEIERDREAATAAKIEIELRLDDAREKHESARAVEGRARTAAAKYLLSQRAAIEQERQQLRDLHLALSTQRGHIEQLEKNHAHEAAAFRSEADAVNARVAAAWSGIADGQAQLAQFRTAADAEFSRQTTEHAARKAHLDEREATLGVGQKIAADKLAALQTEIAVQQKIAGEKLAALQAESAVQQKIAGDRLTALHSEIANLEPRVAAARKALADLETQKVQLAPQKADDWSVPLTPQRDGRSADQLMFQLRQQEQELGRERQRLAQQLHQAAAEREQLAEQRLLVAEQVRSHEAARRQWKDAETQNLAEMEQMARALTQKEADLEARAKAMTQGNLLQNEQLSTLKATLDAWQRSQEVKAAPPSVVTFHSMKV